MKIIFIVGDKMTKDKGSFVLFGLSNCEATINEIIKNIDAEQMYFDIKLILMEAISNAFIHGNNKDENKSIHVRYTFDGSIVVFEIEDCGQGLDAIQIPNEISEDNYLDESGRGLFLIKCYCDKLELKSDGLIIYKTIR